MPQMSIYAKQQKRVSTIGEIGREEEDTLSRNTLKLTRKDKSQISCLTQIDRREIGPAPISVGGPKRGTEI